MLKIRALKNARETSLRLRGFTLTEITIVLGIAGLLIAAIWVAASYLSMSAKMEKAQEEIFTIVQNIRTLYINGGRSTFPCGATGLPSCGGASADDITAQLVAGGVFPKDMIATTVVAGNPDTYPQSPWGTPPVMIEVTSVNRTADAFLINYYNPGTNWIPISLCQNLLSRIAGAGADGGLVGVVWSSTSGSNYSGKSTIQSLTPSSFPGCNEVGLIYTLSSG